MNGCSEAAGQRCGTASGKSEDGERRKCETPTLIARRAEAISEGLASRFRSAARLTWEPADRADIAPSHPGK